MCLKTLFVPCVVISDGGGLVIDVPVQSVVIVVTCDGGCKKEAYHIQVELHHVIRSLKRT